MWGSLAGLSRRRGVARRRGFARRDDLDEPLGDAGGGDRRDLGVIVGRTDFDHIHAAPIDIAQGPEGSQRSGARESARDRRAGAGRERGIERVDVEGEVGGRRADARANFRGDAHRAKIFAGLSVENLEAAVGRRDGSNADLD